MRPTLTRAVGVACALACAVVLPADGARAGVGPELTHYRLDNGLEVIIQPDKTSPSVVVYLWYRVGSKDEELGRTGFAHLFEHLMFKGSKHVADGVFDDLLEAAGGWSNGTTNADRTNYFEMLPAHQLELALYLEADRMAGLWDTMSQAKLDNQREVVKNERRQSYDNQPYGRAELAVQQALWPRGHGNHNLTIGTFSDLSAASLTDVETFYRRYYVPNNATLVIAGGLDTARTRALVNRYFGWIPRRAAPPHVSLRSPVTPLQSTVELRQTDRVQATKLILAWRSPTPFTRESVDLTVAAQLLAGGKSSRLHRLLVFENRLADSVYAYQDPQTLGGEFRIEVILKRGADQAAVRALIGTELARLGATAPPADELARALRMLEVDRLQQLEGLVARADQLAEYAAYTGNPGYLGRDLAMLRSTRGTQIRKSVRTWLEAHGVVITVTPQDGASQ